jgi:poly(hydroxyalkanoate) depolymerase family esterase
MNKIKFFSLTFFLLITTIIGVNLSYADVVFIPNSLKNTTTQGRDLYILLHGCKTTADEFLLGTRMYQWAEKLKFIIFAPEQDVKRNYDRCWNWFLPINQTKNDFSEAEMIIRQARKIKNDLKLNRVFVVGMSSGAAMSAILGSCYASELSGLALHSGISYMAAFDVNTANYIIAHGPIMNNEWTALQAHLCSNFISNYKLPVITFHGSFDTRVVPKNQTAVVEHFLYFNDLIDDGFLNKSVQYLPTFTKKITAPKNYKSFIVSDYYTKNLNKIILRKVEILGLDHAWSGGDPSFPRNDPFGPDATKMVLDFFREYYYE